MSCLAATSGKAIIVSFGNAGLFPQTEIEQAVPLWVEVLLPLRVGSSFLWAKKKKTSEFRRSVFSASSVFPHIPFQLTELCSLQTLAPAVVIDTLGG